MLNPSTPWPPHSGDCVRITASQRLGTVEKIEEQNEGQRFIIFIFPQDGIDAHTAYERDQSSKAARTTYALDELEAPVTAVCRQL